MKQKKAYPERIDNWIDGTEVPPGNGAYFDKLNPHDGRKLCSIAGSRESDIDRAVAGAKQAGAAWALVPPVKRGDILYQITAAMERHKDAFAEIVAEETGKSKKDALGETGGAIALGRFFAGEGQRLYARTTTSGVENKYAMTIRQPVGVAGLIIAANTPIANVAWKVFPALICGNGVVLKAAEDTPITAWFFGKIVAETDLPPGVLQVVQGSGEEAGEPLVKHPDVGVVSFTGSTRVGRIIARIAGERLAKVSLELGGKNPLLVCDDADLEKAAEWVILSAFTNAGQRCASASRIIVFDAVYDRFREMLKEKTAQLPVGPGDDDLFGPVINERQLTNMLAVLERAKQDGAEILIGGGRMTDPAHTNGFYMEPTFVERVDLGAEISTTELFGPIAVLYRAADFDDAMRIANDSPYGLTACIHTTSFDRAIQFTQRIETGVAVVNAATYGSEPHMPFGGYKQSGNGTREPGTEALDIYSELKDVYLNVDLKKL